MNQEELIDMAEKAGMDTPKGFGHVYMANPMDLERFYALAVAKEREECAKVCEDSASLIDHPSLYIGGPSNNAKRKAQQFADAIRARGEIAL